MLALLTIQGQVLQGPRTGGFGGDFALNMGSAWVLEHGGNPYSIPILMAGQRAYMAKQHLSTSLGPDAAAVTWGGYPPLFFWLLEPLTALPFQTVALVWMMFLTLALFLGFMAVLHYLHWTDRWLPACLCLLMPQTTLTVFYANLAGLAVSIIFVSLWLQRKHPRAAGLLFSLALIKPQVAVVVLVLNLGFLCSDKRRFVEGLSAGVVGLGAASVIAVGPGMMLDWIQGLGTVSSLIGRLPNVTPLIGLYADLTAGIARSAAEALLIVVATALTAALRVRDRQRLPVPFGRIAWLLGIWFLVLPYGHIPDEVLLAPAVLAVLGPDARYRSLSAWAGPYILLSDRFLMGVTVHGIQFLSLPLVGLTVLLYLKRVKRVRLEQNTAERRPVPAAAPATRDLAPVRSILP